jgi:hypothetical protein
LNELRHGIEDLMAVKEITAASNKCKHKRKDGKKGVIGQPGGCLCSLFFGKAVDRRLQDAQTISTEVVYVLEEILAIHC